MASSAVRCSDEDRSLGVLLEAFGSCCSLEEIASAYCRSKGDVTAAGDILCKVQDLKTQTSANGQCKMKYQDSADEQSINTGTSEQENKICEIPRGTHIKIIKSKKPTASLGTVSSFLGNSYTRPSYPVKEKMGKDKPVKIEVPKVVVDVLEREPGSSSFEGSKKDSLSNREIEQFLFSMLGEGFKLSLDVIREVLGSCGYDIHKSMEELLDFSARSLGRSKAIDDTNASAGSSSEELNDSLEINSSFKSNNHHSKSNMKDNLDISHQVLQSLFAVPERLNDEPFKPRFDIGANRTRSSGSVVSKPLEEVKMPLPPKDVLRNQLENIEVMSDEDDEYKNLRDAAKQHWDLTKEYFQAAITALANGDHERKKHFLEQGKHYFELAREFEEKLSKAVYEPSSSELGTAQTQLDCNSNKEDDEVISLDLLSVDSKNALYLLKMHICKLVDIPDLQYLKVTVEPESKDTRKTKVRRKVIHLLEKESIQWTWTESDQSTISIRLDQIDRSKLSFAKKFQDIEV
ncbi:smr (Small MutS Related) domain-containing protein [Rhynchospora pubera]|uniref:Smr (Small MutS Related) domain-containing protein n=1 Tax=Rhynchospora pubera TaxID=906938 RepID=A0AAV8H9X4_9POAL|nr:smr (Small MutS Related) domain-containing protein [Rhynchospora pubera]